MNFYQGLFIGFVLGELVVGLLAKKVGVLEKMVKFLDNTSEGRSL